jgi:phenylacetate-CoA ligase
MAVECPRGRLHVAEPLLLEIVDDDGKRLAEGTEGEIVITPLLGHAMPLLRYRMGDRGRRVAGPCPCGRGLPGLSLDVTRTSDTVVLPGGRRASSKFFDPLLNNAFGRRFGVDPIAFRVIQRATERFEIELMLPPGAELPPRAQAFVRTHVRSVLGDGVEVQLTRVSRIDPDPAGKLRCFIPLGEPSSPA